MEINRNAGATSMPPLSPSPKLSTSPPAVTTGEAKTRVAQAVLPQNPTPVEESKDSKGGLADLRKAVDKIQEFVSAAASDIKFSIDEESGRTVVRVIDRETQEVIRQIPSQEMLDLAQALDKLQGLLIKQKA